MVYDKMDNMKYIYLIIAIVMCSMVYSFEANVADMPKCYGNVKILTQGPADYSYSGCEFDGQYYICDCSKDKIVLNTMNDTAYFNIILEYYVSEDFNSDSVRTKRINEFVINPAKEPVALAASLGISNMVLVLIIFALLIIIAIVVFVLWWLFQ